MATTSRVIALSDLDAVCVLANRSLLQWQVTALERMVEETGVDIPLVVVNEVTDVDHPGFSEGASPLGEQATRDATTVGVDDLRLFYQVLQREGLWAVVLSERKLAWLLGIAEPGRSQRRPLDDVAVLEDAERVHCEPVPVDGSWCDLPTAVVDRIADETDVAVRFGFSLLTGSVLTAPAHGVLSFHPADIRRYRGLGPPQPFANGDERAGATLQRLTDKLDGGEVVAIESVDVTDAATLDEIYERVHEVQSHMLARGIERLRDPEFEPSPPASLGEYTPVTRRQDPAFAGKILAKNLRGRVSDLVG